MSRQFEPGRAVEITAPKYGSGYRIGGRLVLTAAHLLTTKVGSTCRVRAKESFGDVDATVVWKAQGSDIALIELPESIPSYTPAVLGQVPKAEAGEKLAFQMYGYPLWGRTQRDEGKTAAGGRQIEGLIYLADDSPDGLLVLEPQRLPPEVTTEGSQWEGASGGAIVCKGLVIAVQSQHQNPRRSASLEAAPLLKVCDDPKWRALLRQHGLSSELKIVRLVAAARRRSPYDYPRDLGSITFVGRGDELQQLHQLTASSSMATGISKEIEKVSNHRIKDCFFMDLDVLCTQAKQISLNLSARFGEAVVEYDDSQLRVGIKRGELRVKVESARLHHPYHLRSSSTGCHINPQGDDVTPMWNFTHFDNSDCLKGEIRKQKLFSFEATSSKFSAQTTFKVYIDSLSIEIVNLKAFELAKPLQRFLIKRKFACEYSESFFSKVMLTHELVE